MSEEELRGITTSAWMSLFHYHPKWIEYSLLDRALLAAQGKTLSDLNNLEHYRYRMFHHILVMRSRLSDEEIAHYLELTHLDEDQAMAQSAKIDLLLWKGLTSEQFEYLALLPEYASPLMQKLIERRRLLHRLATSELTDELFAECLISRDGVIQEIIAIRTDLSQGRLRQLTVQGCSRKVRNMARSRAKYSGKPKIEEEFPGIAEN